jgi:hypothetical protein
MVQYPVAYVAAKGIGEFIVLYIKKGPSLALSKRVPWPGFLTLTTVDCSRYIGFDLILALSTYFGRYVVVTHEF